MAYVYLVSRNFASMKCVALLHTIIKEIRCTLKESTSDSTPPVRNSYFGVLVSDCNSGLVAR